MRICHKEYFRTNEIDRYQNNNLSLNLWRRRSNNTDKDKWGRTKLKNNLKKQGDKRRKQISVNNKSRSRSKDKDNNLKG